MKVVEERDGFLAIRTNGTPVDCIKLSMNILLDKRPDLIVSGINHGSNSGVSVIYSGTMGLFLKEPYYIYLLSDSPFAITKPMSIFHTVGNSFWTYAKKH